jgi:hypothetical protein
MSPRPLLAEFRVLFAAAALLALGAAFMTFVLTTRTAEYFAWPIQPPLSAAFLGASYCAAVAGLSAASRARYWAEGRLAVPPVMTISVLLLAATLMHLDRFDKGHPVFWFWLAAYVLVPPLLVVLVRRQLRLPGGEPPSRAPIPAVARAGLTAHAGLLLGFGSLLFVLPGVAEDIWPWTLTPLTSQALGSFLLGFAAALVFVLRDDEVTRLAAPGVAYAVLGLAQLIAVARYTDDVDFGDPGSWIYVGFFATVLVGGVALAAASRSATPRRDA